MQSDCFCIPIGWPDTWSLGEDQFLRWLYKWGISKDKYYKVGHAAMLLIQRSTGYVEYFDFGRYTTDPKRGRVRSEITDPLLHIPIQAKIQADRIVNLEVIIDYLFTITRVTHGYGVLYCSVYPKMNYASTKQFTDNLIQKGSIRYTTFAPKSTNCARFVVGALLAGSTNRFDRLKLQLPLTLKGSPVGTAVDVGYISGIFRKEKKEAKLEHIEMNRWDNIGLLWSGLKGNLKGKKRTIERNNHLKAEALPTNVAHHAQWLGGLGEGVWLCLFKLKNNKYRVQGFYHDGELNYDIIVSDDSGLFDANLPFQFVYDCSRLFICLSQNGKIFKMPFFKDYQSVSQSIISKNNQSKSAKTA